jgi:RNA recognition motif-containing protein
MAQKVFVGSLSFSTTSEGLRAAFEKAGTVLSATVVTDQFSGRSRGFGFVEMAAAEEAERAVAQLNGRMLDGRTISVELARPKASASRGFSGRGSRGGWR